MLIVGWKYLKGNRVVMWTPSERETFIVSGKLLPLEKKVRGTGIEEGADNE